MSVFPSLCLGDRATMVIGYRKGAGGRNREKAGKKIRVRIDRAAGFILGQLEMYTHTHTLDWGGGGLYDTRLLSQQTQHIIDPL